MTKKAKQKQHPVAVKHFDCSKCEDKGFTEKESGLVVELCDCNKAKEIAEAEGIPWEEDDNKTESPDSTTESVDSGTEQDNQPTGSADTGQPKQRRKSKKKKKARAKSC